MNIIYIGGGYVGTCSAAVSGNSGHDTLVYDIDETKMRLLGSGDRDQIESCLFEEGLADLLVRNAERITFSSAYEDVLKRLDTVDAIFMCLPTPEIDETGESNLTYYVSAAERLGDALAARNGGRQEKYVVIVNKSTVPIDMVDQTDEIMKRRGVREYGVVSNPEFLIEGKAVHGSVKPNRVVVGAATKKDFEVMRGIYQRFVDSASVKYIEVNPKEAAAGKLLANFYLFNRLAVCFDVIGRTCETFSDVRFEHIRQILTSDDRIGSWGFYDSLYAGGSCFIKDARSLANQLEVKGQPTHVVTATYQANMRQLHLFLSRAETEAGLDWHGKKVALLGLSFKQDTNDVRNSPSIDIMRHLLNAGVGHVLLHDPSAMNQFKLMFPESNAIAYVPLEADAIADADVVIISTDWPQYRSVPDILLQGSRRPLIMDGRRMVQHRYDDLQAAGFSIIAVGSPFLHGKE